MIETGIKVIKYTDLENNEYVKKALQNELDSLQGELEKANIIIQNDEDKAKAKEDLANLRKIKDEYESSRKELKKVFNKPYDDFKVMYDTYLMNNIEGAISKLNKTFTEYSLQSSKAKEKEVKEYFNVMNTFDWLTYDRLGLKIGDAKDAVKKSKKTIEGFLNQVGNDLKVIETMDNKSLYEEEYKKTLDLGLTITTIQEALAKTIKVAKVEDVIDVKEEVNKPALEEKTIDSNFKEVESFDEESSIECYDIKVYCNENEINELIEYLKGKGIKFIF